MTKEAYRYASRALESQFTEELREASEQLQKIADDYEDSFCDPDNQPVTWGELVDRYEGITYRVTSAEYLIHEVLEAMQKEIGAQQ